MINVTDIITHKSGNTPLQINNIPQEMKEIPQWIGWKAFPKADGKITKKPYSLDGKYQASFHNGHPFDQVVESYQDGNIDGIGFAMTGAGYICIDLDGESLDDIPDSLKAIANNSYAERSPSGNGLHIWFKGEWPGEKSKQGKENRYTNDGFKVECFYDTGYLTMTGDAVNDLDIEENQELIDFIYNMTFRKKTEKANPAALLNQPQTDLQDEAVLKELLRNKSNHALYVDGDISKFDYDHSKADFALCKGLARISTDAEQIERLFRKSALFRDEPEKHKTYPARTIASAMLNVAAEKEIKQKELEEEFSIVPSESPREDVTASEYFGGPKGTTFIPKWLGDDILQEYPAFFEGNHLYIYKDGVYRRDTGAIIGKLVVDKLGTMFKKDRLNETRAYLQNKHWIDPDDLNKRTDIINVKNGLLEWKTGVLHPHTPDYLSTIQLPITYNPQQKAPNVMKFISEIVPNDAIPTLYEWFGYSMIPSTRYEKALILTGSGANGKSKFLELYQLFLGNKHVSNVALQDLENNRFTVAQLQGKLANVYSDISSQGMEKTDAFKTVTSGDRITAEYKGTQGFEFTPFARLTFSANELPRTTDLSDGYFRRLLIVDFPNKFGVNGLKKDPHIMDKLSTEEELSGLLNIALEGLRRLESNGTFTENESTIKGIEKYKRDVNPMISFLEECCTLEEEAVASKKELYETYVQWSHNSGLKPLGKIRFYRRLEQDHKLKEYRPSPKSPFHYRGIGLQEIDLFE